MRQKSVIDIKEKKIKNEKIVCLTAYDYYHAKILDKAGVDIILVGDSLGMVFAGHNNTLPVTLDDMFYHTQAVSRGVVQSMIVVDMPFLSYQTDEKTAIENCGKFIKAGIAQAVKIEGENDYITHLIKRLTQIGIPVMGHIGLTPQSVNTIGGFKAQGKNKTDAKKIIESAKKLTDSGIFSLVIEAVPPELAKTITKTVSVPTIGIGAGVNCNGQILVLHDILGLDESYKPKFARRYANLESTITMAVSNYAADVKSGKFPKPEETY